MSSVDTAMPSPSAGTWRDYLAMARLDHSTKQVFIVPGIVLAVVLRHPATFDGLAASIVMGFLSAMAIASANYVINEWLDREFDAFHPVKSNRPAVHLKLSPAIVYAEYFVLATIGLTLAAQLGILFFATSVLFVVSGLLYNVRPFRSKDIPYLDVISESINNPIRLILGWTMVDPTTLPPSSLLLAYWFGGAFLMAAKRLSEYRDIAKSSGPELLHRYRRSFKYYTAENLIVSCLTYAILGAFFIAIFLLKYRVEYIIAFPFIALLFGIYFWLALRPGSVAQRPERLFRSKRLIVVTAATVVVLVLTTLIDVPRLNYISVPSFLP